MQLQMLKRRKESQAGIDVDYDKERLRYFIHTLPYELTDAQSGWLMKSVRIWNARFTWIDCSRGTWVVVKFVVAPICMYAAITGGYQAALMAPTEILAERWCQ